MLDTVLMVAAFALILAPLEWLIPARRPPDFCWRRYRTDLLHVVVGGYIIRFGAGVVLTAVVALSGQWSDFSTLPLWIQCLCVLLVADAGFWIAHRLYHAVPWLWRFHRIHHSSEHLDWLATYRVHPLDQIVNSTIILAPVLVLGFSPAALIIYTLGYQWHSILLHSNLRLPFGPLGRVLISPRFHRWHHANEPQALDRNFGGQLILWDWLAGTLYQPDREPARLGVNDPPELGFIRHLVEPFAIWTERQYLREDAIDDDEARRVSS